MEEIIKTVCILNEFKLCISHLCSLDLVRLSWQNSFRPGRTGILTALKRLDTIPLYLT